MKQPGVLRSILLWKKISILFLIILAAFSCTIIGDDDIETLAELNALKLKEIDIVQSSALAIPPMSAKFLYDSTFHFVDTLGNVITRKVAFSMPALSTGSILKYRSGITTAPTFSQTYLADGKPYTARLITGDAAVETYRFHYDDQGRVSRIVTVIDAVGAAESEITNDSLFYQSGEINKVKRWSLDQYQGEFSNFLNGSRGTNSFFAGVSFNPAGGGMIQIQSNQGSCGNNYNGESCIAFSKPNTNGGQGSELQINTDEVIGHQLRLKISRISHNGRAQDSYYFHPLMFIRDQFPQGKILLPFYLYDWFSPGELTNGGNNDQYQNDAVTFDFKYDH